MMKSEINTKNEEENRTNPSSGSGFNRITNIDPINLVNESKLTK